MKMKINEIKAAICKAFAELNEESNRNWDDAKTLKLWDMNDLSSADEPKYSLNIEIGKYDNASFYDVVVTREGWDIVNGRPNDLLEDVMTYTVVPIIFNYANI